MNVIYSFLPLGPGSFFKPVGILWLRDAVNNFQSTYTSKEEIANMIVKTAIMVLTQARYTDKEVQGKAPRDWDTRGGQRSGA
jgi:hypothetical protein